jgi:cyclopropane fatty-acyl-phospholipid synthase-like methyltransferase
MKINLRPRNSVVIEDLPSPIDLRLMRDAREWEQTVMAKRPWRTDFFARMGSEIAASTPPVGRILELGSGPGFLAQHLLQTLNDVSYVLLDFSPAMHELARARLADLGRHAEFLERDFKQADWNRDLGKFDCVVTIQAVHELRHKRYAAGLHTRVRELLAPDGFYLVCDHYCGVDGMQNDRLYMSIAEQEKALSEAGFFHIEQLMQKGGMALYRAM